jgi:hypothetical protein
MTSAAADGGLGPEPPHTVGVLRENLAGDIDGSRWVVLSPDGTPEARVTFPPQYVPMWIDGTRVIGVTSDETGFHSVAEMEVSGLSGAAEGDITLR